MEIIWTMRAGNLRHSITIQEATETTDGISAGGVKSWAAKYTTFAAIWPVSANDRVRYERDTMETTHRIRIRYRADLTSDMRIVFNRDSRTFQITSIIDPEERQKQIDILAKELT